jgi:hypothetical protein
MAVPPSPGLFVAVLAADGQPLRRRLGRVQAVHGS